MTRVLAIFFGVLAALAVCCPAGAQDAAGVALVSLAPARRGSLPEIVTAYGAAAPAQNGGMAVSLQQDGRVGLIMVTQGERVAAGARLLSFTIAATGTSAYAQAVSALALAQTQRAHTAQLLAQHLATRDQLAQADEVVLDARAALAALTEQGANRPRTEVTAPFDSVVESIQVAQGDRVVAGAPLLTLTRLDGLVVTVGIDPALYGKVRPGQKAALRAMDGEARLDGQVLRVDGVVNAKTRLLDVDVSVPRNSVISGALFRADITVGDVSGWAVPHDAVLEDERGAFLFQADAKGTGKATRIAVRVLATEGGTDVVEGALEGARAVVVDGATQLADGDSVRTQPQAGAAPGTGP